MASRSYTYTCPPLTDATSGSPLTGSLWGTIWEALRTNNINATFAQVASDINFVLDVMTSGNTDTLEYVYKDNSTVTVSAGKAVASDGTVHEVETATDVSLDTDLDTGTKAASSTYYLWIGDDASSGDMVLRFSLSDSSPTDLDSAYRLKYSVETDSSSNLESFTHIFVLPAQVSAFLAAHSAAGAHTSQAASEIAALLSSQLLSSAQKTDLTDGGNSTAHYHTADRAATTLGGLSLNSTDRNNEDNKVMRTDATGYANFGWINTTSGDTTASLSRAYVNSGDGYIRMCTLAHFVSQIRGLFVVSGSFSGNNAANRVISTGLSKQTQIVWVMCNTGQQQWTVYPYSANTTSTLLHSLASGSFKVNYNSSFRMNQSGYSYSWVAIAW